MDEPFEWYRKSGRIFRGTSSGIEQEVRFVESSPVRKSAEEKAESGDWAYIGIALAGSLLIAGFNYLVLRGIERNAGWVTPLMLGFICLPIVLLYAVALFRLRTRRHQGSEIGSAPPDGKYLIRMHCKNQARSSFVEDGTLSFDGERMRFNFGRDEVVLTPDLFGKGFRARTLISDQGVRLALPPKAPRTMVKMRLLCPHPELKTVRRRLLADLEKWAALPSRSGERVLPTLQLDLDIDRKRLNWKPLLYLPIAYACVLIILSPFPSEVLRGNRFVFAFGLALYVPLWALIMISAYLQARSFNRDLDRAMNRLPSRG